MIELAVAGAPARASRSSPAPAPTTRATRSHLTERATELGVDATLSVTPYYNKPNRRGIRRPLREIAQATDKPILLYNIPSRTALDMPQRPARRAGADRPHRRRQAGQRRRARADRRPRALRRQRRQLRRARSTSAAPAASCVASHIVGDEMRRMVDEPERRAEIDAVAARRLRRRSVMTSNPTCTKAALTLLGLDRRRTCACRWSRPTRPSATAVRADARAPRPRWTTAAR